MNKGITIAAVAGNRIQQHLDALLSTARALPAHRKAERLLLLSPQKPVLPSNVDWQEIEDWGKAYLEWRFNMSYFFLKRLYTHIDTPYVINVQWDGFGINSDAWTDEFFEYDFVGSPIPKWLGFFLCGNKFARKYSSGFSMLSAAMLRVTRYGSPPADKIHEEGYDVYVSQIHRSHYEKKGIRFAPDRVGIQFCHELKCEGFYDWNSDKSFGRHGYSVGGIPLNQLTYSQAFLNATSLSLHHRFGLPVVSLVGSLHRGTSIFSWGWTFEQAMSIQLAVWLTWVVGVMTITWVIAFCLLSLVQRGFHL